MTAKIAASKKKFVVAIAGAGQGKTYMIIMLAHHLLKNADWNRVVIICKEKHLSDQMKGEVQRCDVGGKGIILVEFGSDFEYYKDPKTVMICDEGDQFLEHDLAKFDGVNVKGLVNLRNQQVYLFTATLDEKHEKLVERLFMDHDILRLPFEVSIAERGEVSPYQMTADYS